VSLDERPVHTLAEEIDTFEEQGHFPGVAQLLREMVAIRDKWYPLGA